MGNTMRLRNSLCICLFVVLNVLSSSGHAESSVWKISKGDKYFYLGGTIHLLNAKDYPLPKEFIDAYRDSDRLIFETDIAGSKTPEFQQKFITTMSYGDERTLRSELKEETYQRLKDFLGSRNIPIESFDKFQPWGVTLIISVLEYQRLGMISEYGVEEYFNKLALSDNKDVHSLESIDEQLSVIKSMGKIEPNRAVDFTLRDLEHLPEFIEVLKSSWRSGDIESFTTNTSIVQMKSEFPEFYNTLVTNRNNAWMSQLSTLNNNNDKEFVLVGTMHLNGKEGLLKRLHLEGFNVEQF